MAGRISSREPSAWLVAAAYLWLIVFGAYLALTEIARGPSAVAGLIVAADVVVAVVFAWLITDRIRSGRAIDVWIPAVAPCLAVLGGIVVIVTGRPLSGTVFGAGGVAAILLLVYREPATWQATARELASRIRTTTPPAPAPEPAVAPVLAPKAVRLTPSERAARFAAEVFALDAAQLDALIEAWEGIDPGARSAAWDAARPYLTAADRKDLLTEVREELKRWAAGEGHGAGAPSQEIETRLRHRGNRALLDAAAGVIAQDRISKHDFDVLYAPFRSAITGEPLKIARRPPSRSGESGAAASASGRATRSKRRTDGASEPAERSDAPAEPSTSAAPAAAGRE